MKQLHDTTKKLAGKYSKPERPIKSKEGKPITEIQEQPAPLNPQDIEATHTDLLIDVTPPTIKEIRMAIRQINNMKAAAADDISAEALK
ncbi:unnamed protein product [Schistosoma curassoni]|uniref:Integrase n=1 Tax=Schistosoma curassoni TaxID=6186 RepID=A0A183JW23_9TREM|nr:unnamed protein product [Schistosoma curassoni]